MIRRQRELNRKLVWHSRAMKFGRLMFCNGSWTELFAPSAPGLSSRDAAERAHSALRPRNYNPAKLQPPPSHYGEGRALITSWPSACQTSGQTHSRRPQASCPAPARRLARRVPDTRKRLAHRLPSSGQTSARRPQVSGPASASRLARRVPDACKRLAKRLPGVWPDAYQKVIKAQAPSSSP